MTDKYLRAMAELENLRKRVTTDIENTARARAIAVAEQFLPLIDAIDAAAAGSPDNDGLALLKKASDATLAKLGVTRIETVGQILNPMFHNAISVECSDCPQNIITKEMQSGFMFGDAVLRAAMVVVSKGKENADKS